jgi:hypothetical protein
MDNLQTMAPSNGVSRHRGFPSSAPRNSGQNPALALDLNQLLIRQASSTYMFRVSGHHWVDQGIYDGDVAVIDRALQAGSRDLIVAWQGNDARLCRQHQLTAEDTPWGVVTAVIHQYRA